MKNTFRKLTTLILALLFTASLPLTALAEALKLDIGNGTIAIGDTSATQNDTPHPHSGTVVVTGSSNQNNVSVEVSQSVTVVLDNVAIDTSNSSGAAVEVTTSSSDAVVTVELNGENTLASDTSHAGLEVSGSGELVIQDETTLNEEGVLVDGADGASLKATAGYGAAGIGGKIYADGNNITITGGTITATGANGGAGIGGGDNGSGCNITITGGNVTAYGSSGAAGIGGGAGDSRYGFDGDADNITISGGNVTAEGGDGGAGIGGGSHGEADRIIITGDSTVNATGGQQAAGIGGGMGSDVESITISGGTVTATGGYLGAGIGGGDGGNAGSIAVSGGTVTATGGKEAAGIGGGEGGKSGPISFSSDSQVTAIGGEDANDIGGGAGQDAVTPDISRLTTNGWYQAGEKGEKIYGSVGAGTSAAADASSAQHSWFRVNARWSQSVKGGVLTVTSDEEDAVLTIKGWGIRGLRSRGIHTLVFVTAQAETTLDIAKLASECEGADKYVLTHTGTETMLTLNGKTV